MKSQDLGRPTSAGQPRLDVRREAASHGDVAIRRVVDRADFDPSYDPDAPIVCEVCGSEMRYTAACKIQCMGCGYKRDCSDP